MAEVFRPTAARFRNRVRFASINAAAFVKLTKSFGLSSGETAAIVIKEADGTKFRFDAPELTVEAAEKWIIDYVDGKLEPYFKSEPRPESQNGPVTVVVRDSFDEIVKQSPGDVLLEFYAPWCGHCKKCALLYSPVCVES